MIKLSFHLDYLPEIFDLGFQCLRARGNGNTRKLVVDGCLWNCSFSKVQVPTRSAAKARVAMTRRAV